jgi:predicted nucleotidyltransferase
MNPDMGIRRSSSSEQSSGHISLADALFTTTQQRVLGALFSQPNRSFYANELIGMTRGGTGAVQREIARLVASGLVTMRAVGNQKHYQANSHAPIFEELRAIAQKTFALAEPLREALTPVSAGIVAAFVYGSVAKRSDSARSDIDLMIVSDALHYSDLYAVLEEVRARLGRPLNVTVLDRADFESRQKDKDSFLTRVLAQPKIWIIGSEDVFSI